MIVNKFKSEDQIYDVAVNVENITNVQNLKQSDLGKQIYSLINNSTPEDITNLVHFSKSKSREYALADTTSGTIYFPYDGIYPIFMGIEWGKNDYSLDEEQIRILSIVRNHISGEEALFDDNESILFDDGQLVEFDTDDNWITKEEIKNQLNIYITRNEIDYLISGFVQTLQSQINSNNIAITNIQNRFNDYYSKSEVYTKDEVYNKSEVYTKTQVDAKIPSTLNTSIDNITKLTANQQYCNKLPFVLNKLFYDYPTINIYPGVFGNKPAKLQFTYSDQYVIISDNSTYNRKILSSF